MRPITLTISGLNSYIQSQTVDFSTLTQRGLFGIFGPTGCGKSTILDGILLALYGYKGLPRHTTEFINLQSQEAVVSFSFGLHSRENEKIITVKRKFKNTKTGVATVFSHLHIQDGGGKTIEVYDKTKDVTETLESILGLNREDFTRSVVLPQGKFSEFLMLTGRQRRDMLERLLDLKAYGSVLQGKIKSRNDWIDKQIYGIEGEMRQVDYATKEMLSHLKIQLEEMGIEESALWKKTESLENKTMEQDRLKELVEKIKTIEEQRREDDADKLFWEKEKNVLDKAHKAKDVVPFYKNFIQQERDFLKKENNVESLKRNCLDQEEKANFAKEKKARREEEILKKTKDILEKEGHALKAIEKIQFLETLGKEETEKKDQLSICTKNLEDKRKTRRQIEKEKNELAKKIKEVEKEKETSRVSMETLEKVSYGVSLEQKNTNLKEQCDKELEKRKILENFSKKAQLEFDALDVKLNKKKEELSFLTQEKESLDKKKSALHLELAKFHFFEREGSWKQFEERKNAVEKREASYFDFLREEENKLETEWEQESKKVPLNFEDEKQSFRLCILKEKKTYFQYMKSKFEFIRDSDLLNAKEKLASETAIYFEKKDLNAKQLEKEIQTIQEKIDKNLFEIGKEEQSISRISKNLERSRNFLLEARANLKAQQEHMKGILEKLDMSEKTLCEFRQSTKLYVEGNFKDIYEALIHKNHIFENAQVQIKLLNEKKEDWELRQQHVDNDIMDLSVNQERLKAQREGVETQIGICKKDILDLVGTQNPYVYKKNLQVEKQSLEKELLELEKFEQVCQENLKVTKENLDRESATLQKMSGKLQNLKEIFERAREKSGFESGESAQDHFLSENDIKKRQETYKKHDKLREKWEMQLASLHEEQGGRIVDFDTWTQDHENLKTVKARLKETAEKRVRLSEQYENIKKDHQKLTALKTRHKKYTQIQDYLRDIKDVVTGNRFVEYVALSQLEDIVIDASTRFMKMTQQRYGLELDSEGNFIVCDHYNGGMKRETKTLSGGETFLASLSLALGLSSQIQLKGQIDLEFFFLDEGFGTLDGNLLDAVMDALETLAEDNLRVGIVSHVENLKNRVPVKLLVSPAKPGIRGTQVKMETT